MTIKQRKTGGILLIAAILVLILLVNICLVLYIRWRTADDAMMINQLGIIRGSGQRAVKLAFAGEPVEEAMEAVDASFRDFRRTFDGNGVESLLWGLEQTWAAVAVAVETCRSDPEDSARQQLLQSSEEFWVASNATVFAGQLLAEEKGRSQISLVVIMVAEFLLAALLLYLIIRIVRRKIEPHALLDPLTGAYNRTVFHQELQDEIERSQRYAIPLSLLSFDIDHFKKVNDTFGHSTGDRVLQELVKHVHSLLRSSDILARTGGEEFSIIAPHTDAESARRLAEKLRAGVEQYPMDLPDPVTCSFGIALFQKGESWQEFYSRADEMLYRAKEEGRNRVCSAGNSCSAPDSSASD